MSCRDGGNVKKRTSAKITKLPAEMVEKTRFATRRSSVTKVRDKIGKFSVRMLSTAGKAGYPHYCACPLDLEHDETDLHFGFSFPMLEFRNLHALTTLFRWNPIGTDRGLRWSINPEPAEPTDPDMRERREKRAIWGRDVLQPEEISFLLSVQEGMSQRSFDQGRHIVDWENMEFSEAIMRHFYDAYLEHAGRKSPLHEFAAE